MRHAVWDGARDLCLSRCRRCGPLVWPLGRAPDRMAKGHPISLDTRIDAAPRGAPSLARSTPLDGGKLRMARTRLQNLSAAQWSPNGGALGAQDLTDPGNLVFGSNVFSPAVQRHRLPKAVYRQLQSTLERGEALDPTLADAVATAMKDWAMEKGATHYTHWF